MTPSQIASLYAAPRNKPHRVVGIETNETRRLKTYRKKGKAVWMDAEGVLHTGTPKARIKGSFVGRAGTVRRSSKGATYRMPNGSRRYETPWEGTAIAYQA